MILCIGVITFVGNCLVILGHKVIYDKLLEKGYLAIDEYILLIQISDVVQMMVWLCDFIVLLLFNKHFRYNIQRIYSNAIPNTEDKLILDVQASNFSCLSP